MKTLIKIFLFLFLSLMASHGEGTGFKDFNTFNPAVDRSQNECECTDARFKAAERDAYQELVQARKEATKAEEDEISKLEAEFKVALEIRNNNLQKALKDCKDTNCSEGTREDNIKYLKNNEAGRQGALEVAQEKKARLYEEAQDKFDEQIKEARQKYCSKSCCGGWTGTVTYTQVISSTIKSTILPKKSAMTITEGGHDDFETTETYSGTIYLDGKSEAKTERVFRTLSEGTINYDYIFTNNKSIYGQVWCSPLQGFKATHGEGSQVRYASGTGNNPTSVTIHLNPTTYSIYLTPPTVVTKSGSFYQSSSGNSCKNNQPKFDTSNSNSTGTAGPGALYSVKKPFGADKNVLSDTSTETKESPQITNSDDNSTTTSTKSIVTTITWNLRRCN